MKNQIFLTPMLLVLSLLSGCAAPSLYNWGGYDQALYSGYKDAIKMEAMRINLQAHIVAIEKSNQKVAPGLYAELGTLFLQTGSSDLAVSYYMKERSAWPESSTLMTAMIQNIERRQQASKEKKS